MPPNCLQPWTWFETIESCRDKTCPKGKMTDFGSIRHQTNRILVSFVYYLIRSYSIQTVGREDSGVARETLRLFHDLHYATYHEWPAQFLRTSEAA